VTGRLSDTHGDVPPIALIEPKYTEGAAGHVAREDREPNINRVELARLLNQKANPERHENL
jgi:hypothetical protein